MFLLLKSRHLFVFVTVFFITVGSSLHFLLSKLAGSLPYLPVLKPACLMCRSVGSYDVKC